MNLRNVFSDIYNKNVWNEKETRSGLGSTMKWTEEIRNTLPQLLKTLNVKTLLDAGCGDWNWFSKIDYTDFEVDACDVVSEIIKTNKRNYGILANFFEADITIDEFKKYDLILCRTVLFHLSFGNIKNALAGFVSSRSTYLLMTNHPHITENKDIKDGEWRRLNFCLPPFGLEVPIMSLQDGVTDDGYLSLWKLENI